MKGWKSIRVATGILVLALAAVGCDSPVDPADHAAGAVFFRADGMEAARFVYPETVTGQLQVDVGGSATYTVRVLTEGGELLEFDGSAYSIQLPRVVIAGAATIALQGVDELVITGVGAAVTTIRFQLHHGGHEEFEVDDVPLVIQ